MDYFIGFFAAMAIGLTGVGGGTLTVPMLILFCGTPSAEAVGTSLLFVTFTKLLATPAYHFRGQINWRTAGALLLGGLPGVVVGALALARMKTTNLQPWVLTVVGVTVVLMSALSLWKLFRRRVRLGGKPRERWLPWLALPIGMEVGFSSAGAGALGTLVLMECTSLNTGTVVGTDLVFGLILSAAGSGMHLVSGNLNRDLFLHLSAGGIVGAATGTWLGSRIPSRPLRAALTTLLVFLGGQLVWQGYQGLV